MIPIFEHNGLVSWNTEEIENRQKIMADMAVKTWAL